MSFNVIDSTGESWEPLTKPRILPQLTKPDFARLIPANDGAKRAFHDVATLIQGTPTSYSHWRKFIYISSSKETISQASSLSSEPSGAETSPDEVFTGHFRLNLSIPPEDLLHGWALGSGRSGAGHLGVDLLLTIRRNQDKVRGRHARLKLHDQSRMLIIQPGPGKRVWLNGQQVSEQGRVLGTLSSGLTIGNLTYTLELIPGDAATFHQRYEETMRLAGITPSARIANIDPTSSEKFFTFHGYQMQTPQALGTFGVVSGCVHLNSGEVYAVKRVKRTQDTFNLVGDEISVLQRLGKHVSMPQAQFRSTNCVQPHICVLVEVIYSDGDDASMGKTKVNDVYMIMTPWAPDTFKSLLQPSVSEETRLRAYHQGAQGLRHIHSLKVIHRDIKLENLLVSRLDPLKVAVADFGQATFESNSNNHMVGTISYLPPEIVLLKRGQNQNARDPSLCWSTASDVYSYGVVGFELIYGRFKRPRHGIDENVHGILLGRLSSSQTAINAILRSMLSWHSHSRPTIANVLLNPFWPEPETASNPSKRGFQDVEQSQEPF
ncbi:hypothetical protein ABEF95_001224 [Exophiala dermatitidis]